MEFNATPASQMKVSKIIIKSIQHLPKKNSFHKNWIYNYMWYVAYRRGGGGIAFHKTDL